MNNGNLYGETMANAGPGQTAITFTESYGYDNANRVSQANDWDGGTVEWAWNFSYL